MKPVVHYKELLACDVGYSAYVFPVDHPNHNVNHNVSNQQYAITSKVINIEHDDLGRIKRFETLNTIYEPVNDC